MSTPELLTITAVKMEVERLTQFTLQLNGMFAVTERMTGHTLIVFPT